MAEHDLARFGGTPVVSFEELSQGLGKWPDTTEDDLSAVNQILTSNHEPWGFLHPVVRGFQEAYGDYVNRKHCLAVSSGTASLHLAVAALDAPAGSEIITPALGFVASATCVLHNNSIPVFADIDPATFNLSVESLEKVITERTRGIIAVDLLGLPASYGAIHEVANRHNLQVIEDASQSQGATYKGKKAGALGDISAMSIMASKNLPSCGEGGLLTTDDDELFARILGHASHGMNLWNTSMGPRPVSYQLGFNYRPTPTSLAFTWSQLHRLQHYQSLRNERVKIFEEGVSSIPFLQLPVVPEDRTHGYQMYRILVKPEALGLDRSYERHLRDALVFLLRAEGGLCGFWESQLLPEMELFQKKIGYGGGCPWTCYNSPVQYSPADFPNSQQILDSSFMAFITRATHSEELIRGQVEVYQKLAAHPEVLVDLATKLKEVGGFESWCGISIFDDQAQRDIVLKRK